LLGADRRDALYDLDRAGLAAAVDHAAKVAAVTVTRPGADPPTAQELAAAYPDA
jgi:fructokinase